MAKIDWSRHRYDRHAEQARASEPAPFDRRAAGLWTLPGRYLNHSIAKLPVHYLGWILDNCRIDCYRQQAEDELRRRWQSQSDTQGRRAG